jgi:hypothetical protein
MNIKTTLILLVLLILVAIGFLAVTNRPAGPATAPAPTPGPADPLFTDLAAEGIDRLTIARGEQRLEAVREAETWVQVQPVRFPLDDQAMQELAEALAGLSVAERFVPGGERTPGLGELGLDPPRGMVQLGADGPTLLLGKAALGGLAYARLSDEPEVLVVGDDVHEQVVAGSLLDLRRRTLPVAAPASVTRVSLGHEGGAVALHRVDGDWRLDEAGAQRANDDAVRQLLGALRQVRAQAFVADAPPSLAVYGLAEPRLTVSLTTPGADGSPQPATLRVGAPADLEGDSLYATWTTPRMDQPVVFTVSAAQITPLTLTADDLREPRLLNAGASAHRVRIERPDLPPLVLQRDGEQWGFAEGSAAFPADAEQAGALIRRLIAAEAERFEPLPEANVAPVATIQVASPTQPEPQTVQVYPPVADDAPYRAVPAGSDVAYAVPARTLMGVFEPAYALRDRVVAELEPGEASLITLELPDGRAYRFARDGASWTLEGDATLERQALTDLLARLDPLRATGWTGDTALPEGPVLTLTLDGATPRTLRVDPETRRATLDDVQGVFTVSEALVSLLTAEYRKRKLLPLADDLIRTVTLRSGEQTLTVLRSEDGTLSAQPTVDEATAAQVINAVADLRVHRYVQQPVTEPLTTGPGLLVTVGANNGQSFELVLRAPGDVLPSVATGAAGLRAAFVAPEGAVEALSAALEATAGTGADAPR